MTKFSDLKLDPKVLQAIAEAGYETPTPIQAGAIPHALEGRDVLGIAQTGTGKTASFTLPMITLLGRGRARARMPRSLVMCPTRELAAQVAENFDTYAKHTRLTKALLIGGVSFSEQDKLIDRGVDVLIATPGRLLDHFERGKLLLTGVQIMVVDEADRMLDMGFIPDIERIFQLTPFTRQTLFFSATMAPEIERITDTFLHSPERIEVARQATASETITQRLVEITPIRRDQTSKQKRALLRALIDAEGEALTNAIVFCNRKTDVDIVAKSLKKHGYDAAPIHGDLDQSHRTRTLDGFRDGRLKLLIASDVAARGLDIPAVSHVFNFDLPSHAEDYVHRIGRTGRAGRSGTAISIGTPADDKYLAAIETLVNRTLPRSPAPDGFEVTDSGSPAPRSDREDRKGARGDGKRRRGRRDEERPAEPSRPARPREDRARTAEAEAPRGEDRDGGPARDARRDEPREDRRQDRRDQGRDQNRDHGRDDRRGGRGRGRDDSRGPAVMGMGDHVPQFMLVELRTSQTDSMPEADSAEDVATETVAASAGTASETPKPSRSRSRGGRRRKAETSADDAAPNAAAAGETAPSDSPAPDSTAENAGAAPEAVAPDQPAAAEAETAQTVEAPAKPKRTRRKKADEAATEAGDAPAATAPRKSRARKAAQPEQAETPAETTDETPKPRRSRRKKADTAEGAADEAAAPAPRRSRRSKAAAADEAPADAGAPTGQPADRADADA